MEQINKNYRNVALLNLTVTSHVASEKKHLTFLSLRMKRISISQRNVAAAPVHTKMMTSTFAFPSSPEKRTALVNDQNT